jgi:hypothetical protein
MAALQRNWSRRRLRQLGEERHTVDQKWRREKALMVGLTGKEKERLGKE